MTTLGLDFAQDLQRNDDIAVVRAAPSSSPLAAIADGVRVAIARYHYRQTVLALSHLRPHLLRDIGFEPEAVYEAAEGDWRSIDARGRRG